MVNARTVVMTLHPAVRNEFRQVAVSFFIFGQQHQVVTAAILFQLFIKTGSACHVHLRAKNRFENLQLRSFQFIGESRFFRFWQFIRFQLRLQFPDFCIFVIIFLFHIIVKFLDTKHASVVGQCQRIHPAADGFIYQSRNT